MKPPVPTVTPATPTFTSEVAQLSLTEDVFVSEFLAGQEADLDHDGEAMEVLEAEAVLRRRSCLLALGLRSSLVIVRMTVTSVGVGDGRGRGGVAANEPEERVSLHVLREIHHDGGGRVQCLSWDPATSTSGRCFRLATGDARHVRLFTLSASASATNSGDGDRVRVLTGHTDYVNTLSFQPPGDNGDGDAQTERQLVSGGDDGVLNVYNAASTEQQRLHTVTFGSPVMTVKWHPMEKAKLLVAEKSGLIHLFNMITFKPIQSFDCGEGPLSSADWCLSNSLLVLASIRSDVFLWDLSRPSTPVLRKTVHEDGVRKASFANTSPDGAVIATAGRPGYTTKVFNTRSSQVLFHSSFLSSASFSWHPNLDYLAVSHDHSVKIHQMSVKQ